MEKHLPAPPRQPARRRSPRKPGARPAADFLPPRLSLTSLRAVKPRALVCMGATTARAAFGRAVRLQDYRVKLITSALSPQTLVTIHPSAILRLRETGRTSAYRQFVADLKQISLLITVL